MSCRGTYVSQFHTNSTCASDFGAPASDDSRFIRADQASLVRALQTPRLRAGDCFCLRTNPLCGQTADRAFLCVGQPVKCQPELLPVYIRKYSDPADKCQPCQDLSNPDFYWSNSRGVIVPANSDCEENLLDTLLNAGSAPSFVTDIVTGSLLPGALVASRGQLICVRVYIADTASSDNGCCSDRRQCIYYATRLPSCNDCCPIEEDDCGCCPACDCSSQ